MAFGSYKMPIIPPPRVRSGYDFDTPTRMEYDEVIYDPRTNRYLTLSQEKEIERLNKELEEKKVERRKDLENIIGYFYRK